MMSDFYGSEPFVPMDDGPSEIEDAIIEDTVHCDLCGASWTLGGHEDGVCITNPVGDSRGGMPQLKLCIDCAMRVGLAIQENIRERDICEHGVCCGDWCEPCNKAYKQAIIDNAEKSQ